MVGGRGVGGEPTRGSAAWRVVHHRWRIILLVLIPWALCVTAYVLSQPVQHSAVSVVSIVPDGAEAASSDFISVTASRYAVAMTSTGQLEEIADETGVSAEELQHSVTVDTTAPSANIKITATVDDPSTAKRVADAVADHAVDRERASDQLTTTKVSPAVLQKDSLLSSRPVLLTVLLLAGIALAVWVAFVVERTRPSVRTPDDLELAADAPSLATVDGRRATTHRAASQAAALRQAQALQLALDQAVPGPLRQVAFIGIGATTGTAAAAHLLARTLSVGERVLLIDADMASATLSRVAGDVPRSSVTEALESGRAPDPLPGRAGLHLLGHPAADHDAGRDVGVHQWTALLEAAAVSWDVVVLAAPTFDRGGGFRQRPVPSTTAVLVVPQETSVSAVRAAARQVRLIHSRLPGAVLFRGPSDR